MAHERKCMMCGQNYKFCSHCNDFDPTESWKYLYHDKKCMDIANIWYAYRGKEISKDVAKEQMSQIKPNIDEVLKYDSLAAKEIKEIFDIKAEPDKADVDLDEKESVASFVDEQKDGQYIKKNNVKENDYSKKNYNNKKY